MVELDAASQKLSPLPAVLTRGLIAVSTFAFLSFFCSTVLFLLLTYRLFTWHLRTRSQAPNQFLILIYNLLLADIKQSIAFFLNAHSLRYNAIDVGASECWAQGWFVSVGDLSSSVFILAIALHTFAVVVKGYRMPNITLFGGIGALWVFIYLMAIIGVALHPDDIYVRAGAWCWINDKYQQERLWLHYFWVFLCIGLTIGTYTLIYITVLRRSRSSLPSTDFHQPTHMDALSLMMVYPCVYAICTFPLAAGRIASMAGNEVSLSYFCVAGAMIASNGWLDALLYGLTRRSIVFGDITSDKMGLETFIFVGKGMEHMGTVTTIQGGAERDGNNTAGEGRRSRGLRRVMTGESTENLYSAGEPRSGMMKGIGVKTETTVVVRPAGNDVYELQKAGGPQSHRVRDPDTLDTSNWQSKSRESFVML
ncbi:MAG: hypothetical protein M1818_000306 [Claussenomyces sp. TS43310]|nr:MAG: hypothetical protein M1818_000306 [Claussenomyces sp. TS43310]